MEHEPLQLENHCYVLLQGNWIHPIAHRRHELMWYPERALTVLQQHCYRPYVKSVVTECDWIIACYPRERVRVLDEDTGAWVRPFCQTYGASRNSLTLTELGIRSTIPAMVLDGGKEANEFIAKYAERVDKANKLWLAEPYKNRKIA